MNDFDSDHGAWARPKNITLALAELDALASFYRRGASPERFIDCRPSDFRRALWRALIGGNR